MNDASADGSPAAASARQPHRALVAARPDRDQLPAPGPERLALRALHHVEPEGRRVVVRLPAGHRHGRAAGRVAESQAAGIEPARRRAGPGAAPGSAASRPRSARGPGRRWEPGGRADARPCWEPMIPAGAGRPGWRRPVPAGGPDVVSACADPRDRPRRRRRQPVRRRDAEAVRPARRRPDPAADAAGPRRRRAVDRVVVVSPPGLDRRDPRARSTAASLEVPVTVVAGGATRNESTRNGLAALDGGRRRRRRRPRRGAAARAARRRSSARSSRSCPAARTATDTVIPSADTLVIVEDDEVVEIPERSRLPARPDAADVPAGRARAAPTRRPTAAGDLSATDDCSLVLRHVPGARIVAVAGDEVNLKITTRIDMVMADRMLQMHGHRPRSRSREAERLARGRPAARGRRDERDRARDRRRGDPPRARRPRSTAARWASTSATTRASSRASTAAAGAAGRHRPRRVHRRHPAHRVRSPTTAAARARARSSTSTSRARSTWRGPPTRSCARVAWLADGLHVELVHARPARLRRLLARARPRVVNMTQGLSEEWADDGIRVNAVSPERTDTPMRRKAFPGESPRRAAAARRRSRSRRCGCIRPT